MCRLAEAASAFGVSTLCIPSVHSVCALRLCIASVHSVVHCVMADQPNAVWCLDFLHENTLGGSKLRVLCISDEFTRAFCVSVMSSFGSHGLLKWVDRSAANASALCWKSW